MKIFEIFRPFTRLFQPRNRKPLPTKRSIEKAFSYIVGKPDDDMTKEAFRMLREMREKDRDDEEMEN